MNFRSIRASVAPMLCVLMALASCAQQVRPPETAVPAPPQFVNPMTGANEANALATQLMAVARMIAGAVAEGLGLAVREPREDVQLFAQLRERREI